MKSPVVVDVDAESDRPAVHFESVVDQQGG
jgi:hypothetical protein